MGTLASQHIRLFQQLDQQNKRPMRISQQRLSGGIQAVT